MIKYKKYGYWYQNWNTINTKASQNRRTQWWLAIMKKSQLITTFQN